MNHTAKHLPCLKYIGYYLSHVTETEGNVTTCSMQKQTHQVQSARRNVLLLLPTETIQLIALLDGQAAREEVQ